MGVIFDLDGTLINSLWLHTEATKKACDEVLGRGRVQETVIRENIRFPSPIMFDAIRKHGIRLSREQVVAIVEQKRKYFTASSIRRVKLFKSSVETMKMLRKNGIRYCIATAMYSRDLAIFIKELRLERFTDVIINPPAFGYEKPNPYILNRSIELMGMKQESSAYVGDSPYDFITAKRAGIHFLGVYNKSLRELGPFFEDFVQLKAYLSKNLDFFRD